MKRIKGEPYYVVLCQGRLICGVFSTKAEAQELKKRIACCVAPHTIKKCRVTVDIITNY